MNPSIEMHDVTKYFGNKLALDHVSFTVQPGQVFALLGDNGAGKSTAIRTLLGLVKPDRGEARMMGLDSTRNGQQIRQQVGYVPDQLILYDWMTVDQIGWFAAGFARPGFLHDYRSRVTAFGLDLRAKIKTLSKGMRAKVGLALAVASDPPILVLDEPTSGLDVIVRRDFLESMVDVAASGRTVLLSSHQITEVERVADTVAIMHEGRILINDSLETLKLEIQAVHVVGTILETDNWPGEVLSRETKGKQSRLIIRSSNQTDLAVAAHALHVEHVEIHSVSLEDIFIAYMTRVSARPRQEEFAR